MKSQNSSRSSNKFYNNPPLRENKQVQQLLQPNQVIPTNQIQSTPQKTNDIEKEILELSQKLTKLQKEREVELKVEQELNYLDQLNKENNANFQNYTYNQPQKIEAYQYNKNSENYSQENLVQGINQDPAQLYQEEPYEQDQYIDNADQKIEQQQPFYPSSLSTLKRLQEDQFLNKQKSSLLNNYKPLVQQKLESQKSRQQPKAYYQYSTDVNQVLHESPQQYAPETLSNSSLNHNYMDYFTKLTQKQPQSTVDLQNFSNSEKQNLIKKNCQALTRMTEQDSEHWEDMKQIQKNVEQFRRRLQVVAQKNPMNEVQYFKDALQNRLLANLKIERKQKLIQILRNEHYL